MATLSRPQVLPENREARLGGIGAAVAKEIEARSGKETRACVLGHLQRGGSPTSFDRALCSVFGAHAVELIAADDFGKMVAFLGSHVSAIPIGDAVGKLKTVRADGSLARTARRLESASETEHSPPTENWHGINFVACLMES